MEKEPRFARYVVDSITYYLFGYAFLKAIPHVLGFSCGVFKSNYTGGRKIGEDASDSSKTYLL